MKQFFKTMFACILGVFLSGFLGSMIMLFVLVGMAATSTTTYIPVENTIFKLELNSSVVETTSNDPMNEIINSLSNKQTPLALNKILKAIDVAKNNDKISGIYLKTDGYSAPYATSEAIRRKLDDFKKSGKFIISYNDFYSQNQFYISTVSDSTFLNPMGAVSFSGLASSYMFYKKALDKLGVEVQVFRVGTFKSAVEPFILDKMSEANREQVSVYMNSIWNTLLNDISISKGISVDSLNSIANLGLEFQDGEASIKTGLISGLKYQQDMDSILIKKTGVKELKTASIDDILSIKETTKENKNKIALLYASGDILSSNDSDGIYWVNTIAEIKKIKEDKDVKALVFRVNSPGGSAFASEQIWNAIEDLKKTKPVVVSMGDYAASGGYYISCNANYIVAEPTTITGSIGVFGLIPNANKLLTDKLGLSIDEVKTNKFGNITYFQPVTEAEGALIQKSVENTYYTFKKRCADGRNLPIDSIAAIAEGRVWTGENALNIGLVDELGGIDKAISKAQELAAVTDYSIVEYPKEKELIDILLEEFSGNSMMKIKQQIIGEEYKYIKIVDYLRSLDKIQARIEPVIIK
ncbi:MAG: signal peptide peptidase SppA [Bacteroidales bacterium]|nr:signal peptide peptidase SppA [Bacteroidales bacterium]